MGNFGSVVERRRVLFDAHVYVDDKRASLNFLISISLSPQVAERIRRGSFYVSASISTLSLRFEID